MDYFGLLLSFSCCLDSRYISCFVTSCISCTPSHAVSCVCMCVHAADDEFSLCGSHHRYDDDSSR